MIRRCTQTSRLLRRDQLLTHLPLEPDDDTDRDRFGSALLAVDMDGDLHEELFVGAPDGNRGAHSGVGNVYQFKGGPSLTPVAELDNQSSTYTIHSGAHFGTSLAAGDFDNNGTTDIAVGAPSELIEGTDRKRSGAVYIFDGGSSITPELTRQLKQAENRRFDGNHFGAALAAADFDQDGTTDLAVGIPSEIFSNRDGQVDVYYGSGSGPYLEQTLAQYWNNNARILPYLAYGASLLAGDFNGDGADDLAIGAPGTAVLDNLNSGSVAIYRSGERANSKRLTFDRSVQNSGMPYDRYGGGGGHGAGCRRC